MTTYESRPAPTTTGYYHDPDGSKWRRREARIAEMMAARIAAGQDGMRGLCELMYDNEEAPEVTARELLDARGIVLPPAASMDDESLSKALRELIDELARMRTFLEFTDHLTDRELYELLLDEVLSVPEREVPLCTGSNTHIDISDALEGERREEIMDAYYDDDGVRGPGHLLVCDRDSTLPSPW